MKYFILNIGAKTHTDTRLLLLQHNNIKVIIFSGHVAMCVTSWGIWRYALTIIIMKMMSTLQPNTDFTAVYYVWAIQYGVKWFVGFFFALSIHSVQFTSRRSNKRFHKHFASTMMIPFWVVVTVIVAVSYIQYKIPGVYVQYMKSFALFYVLWCLLCGRPINSVQKVHIRRLPSNESNE